MGESVRRVLVGWVPDWPVVAVLGREPEPDCLAAVAERGRILAASGAARAAGVRGGQKVRTLQALVADLEVFDRNPDVEAQAFEPVADAVGALAAHLEVVRPGLLAVAAAGAARFHGGEEALVERG